MSVLIKGMEMPKNCIDCAFGWNGWCHRINSRAFVEVDMRRHDCPLIEVPPHGRLIDADALDKHIYNDIPLKVFGNVTRMAKIRDIVCEAPTIIPSDKDGET